MSRATTGRLKNPCIVLAALAVCGCAAPGGVSEPESGYVPGASYHLVMAEIAARRAAYPTAADEYLNAAERSDDPEVSQRAAAFAFEFGFDAHALRAARRWAQLAPDNASAQLYLARLLIRRNDVAGAAAAADRALGPAGERAPEDYQLLAGELLQEENSEGVTRVMTRLAAIAPATQSLHLGIARAALRSRDFDLALESAHAALASEADAEATADANLLIARVLLARGDGEAALEHMARLVETESSLETGVEYARLLAATDRHGDALRELDALKERYGPDPEILRLRALVHLDAGDARAAWESFGELLREGDFGDESLYYLGEIAEKEGRAEQAAELFARVPDGPYLVPAQAGLARVTQSREDADAALRRLSDFGERYPRLAFEASRLRASMLQGAGRTQEARELLDESLRYRPTDAELLLARGALLEQMNELEPALADMRAALAIMPDSAVALNALGYTLANRTRKHAEAFRLIRRAIEREPGSAAILDSYGWVLYQKDQLPEARSYLQLAWSRLADPEVAAHLGEVMWKQGDEAGARRLWEEALEQAPDSAPLKDTMARFVK
jgi:tetratricopeptide (TPR) repeat protein